MLSKQKAVVQKFQWQDIRRNLFLQIVLSVVLCLSSISVQAAPITPPLTTEALLELATSNPDMNVRLIVQKHTQDNSVENLVEDLGGQVVRPLPLINGLVVDLPANGIPTLARAQGVRYVSLDAPMISTSESLPLNTSDDLSVTSAATAAVQTSTVRDEFNLVSFSNNDGAVNWAAPWVENDTEIGGAGPTVGQARVTNGQLRLDDTPDTGGQPSVARSINLIGAVTAVLSFDYRTTIGVDPDDAVVVEVSSNGGTSYSALQTFTGITGISLGSRSFDISGFISANTQIRFRVSNLYGASEEFFFVDNVQIAYSSGTGTVSGPSNLGRYIRLVAKSEVNGNPWTSVAELSLLDAAGNLLPKTGWSVVSVDSQETVAIDGRGLKAIDGNPATYWHTQLSSATPVPPHQIVINMGASYILSGFRYLTRQDNSDKGNIANYSFYVSQDGVNWGEALSSGTLLNTPAEQTVIFGKDPVADPVFTTWATTLGTASATDIVNALSMVNATGFGPDGFYAYQTGNGKGTFTGYEVGQLPGYAIKKVEVVIPSYVNSLFSKDFTIKPYINGSKIADVKVTTDIFQNAVGVANTRPIYIDITSIKSWVWADFYNNLEIAIATGGMSSDHSIYYDAIGLRVTTKPGVDTSADNLTVATTQSSAAINTSNLVNTFPFVVRAPSIWNAAPAYLQGQGMTIAVVDSGIAKTDDLKGRNVIDVNFNQSYKNGKDLYGHGTFVASMIAGDGKMSSGAYMGIAPKSHLLNVRVSDDQGMSYESDVVEALQWIRENKTKYNIRVVNLSLNSSVTMSYHDSPLNAAVQILWFNGIVVVVAAGNNGTAELFAPANDPYVITVGATDDVDTQTIADDVIPAFSAYGVTVDGYAKPDLVAPGKDIVMYLPNNNKLEMGKQHATHQIDDSYFRMSGTSMAAPVVSGAVALLLQDEPNLTPNQVKYRLMASARKDWGGYDPARAGAGYLDIFAAVNGTTTQSANQGVIPHQLLAKMALMAVWANNNGGTAINWGTVNWNSVNWNSVNWNSVNWNSVNWNSVNWNSVNWNSVNWNSVNWNSVNWNSVNWNSVNWNSVNWNSVNWNSANWNSDYWESGSGVQSADLENVVEVEQSQPDEEEQVELTQKVFLPVISN